jgi:hypothetical protein
MKTDKRKSKRVTSAEAKPDSPATHGSEIARILKDPAAVRVNILRGNIARPAGLLDISEVQYAVESEPEMPGQMPDEMWDAIRNDRDACAEAMRIAVRQTKSGILGRINKLNSPNDAPSSATCGKEASDAAHG